MHDINAGRRDSFGLLQSVLMNVIGLYVSCKFGGNVKLLMYDELQCDFFRLKTPIASGEHLCMHDSEIAQRIMQLAQKY